MANYGGKHEHIAMIASIASHNLLARKAFWLKVESLKKFCHATGADCFEAIIVMD